MLVQSQVTAILAKPASVKPMHVELVMSSLGKPSQAKPDWLSLIKPSKVGQARLEKSQQSQVSESLAKPG